MNKLEEQRLLHKLFVFAFMNYGMPFNEHSYLVRTEGVPMRKIFEAFPEDEAVSTLYFRESLEKERRYIESYEAVTNKIIEK